MKRHLRLWSRLLSIPFHWPGRRWRMASDRQAAGRAAARLRRQPMRLDVQSLEPKLALAAAAGTKVAAVIPPAAGSYTAGDQLVFNVAFTSAVTVTGTPELGLTIGRTGRPAAYFQGSGSSVLGFRYTVQQGEIDADGIALAKSITLPAGAAIRDIATEKAVVTDIKPPSMAKVLIDSVAPVVASITGPAGKAYGAGAALSFTVNFNEKVFVTGVPTLPITAPIALFSGVVVAESTRSVGAASDAARLPVVSAIAPPASTIDRDGTATFAAAGDSPFAGL
ncbi:MAG: hypothetical protein EBZ59_07455 [Planctomycetia bacterium]|nr:hypothetical protein [Planctomycetia bacterium]